MRHFIFYFSLVLSLFLGVSCDKKNNITQQEEFSGNLSGVWIADEVINGTSTSGNYPRTRVEIFNIIQSSNSFKIIINSNDTSTGTLSGNTIKWKGSRVENDAVLTIDFSGQIAADSKSFTGTANWTSKSSSYSESGTVTISAWKNQNRKLKLSGQWQGTYNSFNGYGDGNFSVNIKQTESVLSGTITLPSLSLTEEEITGKVIDNCWSFGDIKGRIKFVGIMDNDSLHFRGSYTYASYDEGKWSIVKTSDSTAKMAAIVNFYPVSSDYNADLAYDGSYLWLVNNNKLFKYTKEGILVDSISAPGSYTTGLAYDGTNLIVADGKWGLNKIFTISKDGKDIIKIPVQGYISGLTKVGNNIWCIDMLQEKIYCISENGVILNEIALPDKNQLSGLTYAENYLWFSGFDFSAGEAKVFKMDLNGNIAGSFPIERILNGGMTYDGTNLLLVSSSDNKIYKYKTDGTLQSQIQVSLAYPSQIAYDGSNIWMINNSYQPESMIYKLNSSGKIIDSLEAPGQGTGCITFADNYLWYYNSSSGKLIKVDLKGPGYFNTPAGIDLKYLDYSNSKFWALDNSENKVYSFSSNGKNVSSINSPVKNTTGIAVNENELWLLYRNDNYKYMLCKSGLSGTKTDEVTIKLDNTGGLLYDGEFFWTIGSTYSSSYSGNYLVKIKIQ
jgi:sugar lactone lactonase YvrE